MTRRPEPAVGAVVFDDQGRILLIRRGRGAYAGRWAVPGGRQRMGETMQEAARREVAEETGLDVEVGPPIWVGDIIDPTDPPRWHYAVVDFLARPIAGDLSAADDADDVRWVSLDDIADYDLTPTMYDLIDVLVSKRPGRSDTG